MEEKLAQDTSLSSKLMAYIVKMCVFKLELLFFPKLNQLLLVPKTSRDISPFLEGERLVSESCQHRTDHHQIQTLLPLCGTSIL